MYMLLQKVIRVPVALLFKSDEVTFTQVQRTWLQLGLASLLLSGLFSVVIVAARAPIISIWINDPNFARKSLVLHVDLALVVVFYCFLAALYVTYSGYANLQRAHAGARLAVLGILAMVATVFIPTAEPILSNYIPVLNHPLFVAGLAFLAAGFAATFINVPWSTKRPPSHNMVGTLIPSASISVRWGGLVVTVAIITFTISAVSTPTSIHPMSYFEAVMWGGGHILQFANVLGMITVWLVLTHRATGKDPVTKRTAWSLTSLLAIPTLFAPLLIMRGTGDLLYHNGFTQLMRWFIFPVVVIFMSLMLYRLWSARGQVPLSERVYRAGIMVSILLTITGFVIGFMIRGSNTLVPAHYHASLGGVTVAYMTMIFLLLERRSGVPGTSRLFKLRNMQPYLFGVGQAIFVIGFAYAGHNGMGRKMFGSDQIIHDMSALVGLSLMSIGGLLAMVGGLLFLYLSVKLFRQRTNQNTYG